MRDKKLFLLHVTKLACNNFYYSMDFFGEMLHGSFVSYRFVFMTCVPGAAYLLQIVSKSTINW